MRKPFHYRALLLLTMLTACGGNGGSSLPPPQSKAPNIVFILSDDLDAVSVSEMTRLKKLVTDQGARLNQHYVSLSLCCPSRVAGLRGQFAHNTGIYTNSAPEGGFEATYAKGLEASTAATWLQAAGYRTALFGKYLNGYPNTAPSGTYVPPGWTEWYSPNAGTPYKGFDYTLNENGTSVSYGSTPADYMTDVLSAKAADFIRRSVSQFPEQPFFAYVATYAPHSPATPAPRHANAYPGVQAPRTASFNEADVSDKPLWVQDTPLLDSAQIADIDRRYQHRLQSLLAVDELVQKIVDTLQAAGQLDNTYIFFTSDNGYHLGQHRLEAGKMTAFEEDLWVPMVVRGPGVAAGTSINLITANVDHAPTFADIARAALPDWVDGRSLLPLLRGQVPADWRQTLLLEHKNDVPDDGASTLNGLLEPPDPFDVVKPAGAGIAPFSGLRTADGSTYVEYEDGEFELYDNRTDPAQLANGYATASADRKASLKTWLSNLRSASGVTLRQAEQSTQ
jgi:N-acetylglucosamine-6-sulfatase